MTLSPILLVEAIEPCLPFWVDRLGFMQVDQAAGEDGRLLFVKLRKEGVEIMYHTRAGVARDLPDLANAPVPGSTILHVQVDNLDDYEQRLDGIEPVICMRETSYGSAEIYVREPAGNIIAFAVAAGY